jgi:Ca2+-transporting ATPase
VRLNVAGLYRSDSLKELIESGLHELPGIEAAIANVLTGHLLVVFGQGQSMDTVIDRVESLCRRELGAPAAAGATVVKPAAWFARPRPAPDSVRPSVPAPLQHAGQGAGASWHRIDASEALAQLRTSPATGLTSVDSGRRLQRFGPNTLPRAEPRSSLSILLGQFASLPVALLGASAVLSLATGGLADAVVIVGVVLINAAIGYVTEVQAERTITSLANTATHSALLVRDGAMIQVPAETVVPGDILVLSPGMYVAADARLLEIRELTADESALTGESLPVKKSAAAVHAADTALADRTNMVYMGTVVTGGSGLAAVVATGMNTEIGTIQALVGDTRPPDTPMQKQLERLGNQMVWMSGAICGVVFGVGLLRGYGVLQMLKAAVSLAVAAVPEGLPTVATTTLALGIRSMRRHRVLIRSLAAVETLGAVQVMCMDKTGTLTRNRMSVLAVHVGMKPLRVGPAGFLADGVRFDPMASDELLRLLHVAVLCNESRLEHAEGQYQLNGSATENALIHLALTAGVGVAALRAHYPVSATEYRAENRNYMRTLHAAGEDAWMVAVKGSPLEVLGMCGWYIKDGVRHLLGDDERMAIVNANERMAGEALRVLGFAYKVWQGEPEPPAADLVWIGLAGMADPIREGVPELIGLFHRAGIKTVMITGDQSATAYAVGKELGLSGTPRIEILDSAKLETVDPVLMSALAERIDVFARVSPAHKLQIVKGLQRAGKVVAMTGDGINDGPALKAADIGVAMGSSGTDVARDVADVLLEDDELQTMIVAVSEGRTIYNNIRKAIHFLMSSNMSEIAVMLAAIGTGLGQPLNPMQLLWINLITDVFPGLALAMEPPEPDVLSHPPRDPDEPIIRRQDMKYYAIETAALTAGTMASYGFGVARYGLGPQANTLAFMTLTTAQLLHAFSCRSETHGMFVPGALPRNRWLELAAGGSLAVQALTVLVPGLRSLLGCTPIGLADVAVIAAGSIGPLLINEATKTLRPGVVPSARPALPAPKPVLEASHGVAQ